MSNWFPFVRDALQDMDAEVIAQDMPDPALARKDIWLPFIEKYAPDVLIGHSSGAVAIMRYLEKNPCRLAILVGAYYTDLGDYTEQQSGYFEGAWQWDTIRKNAGSIHIFASTDDPYIPIEQARFIRDHLDAVYHEYDDQGHFGEDVQKTEFPEIVKVVQQNL